MYFFSLTKLKSTMPHTSYDSISFCPLKVLQFHILDQSLLTRWSKYVHLQKGGIGNKRPHRPPRGALSNPALDWPGEAVEADGGVHHRSIARRLHLDLDNNNNN